MNLFKLFLSWIHPLRYPVLYLNHYTSLIICAFHNYLWLVIFLNNLLWILLSHICIQRKHKIHHLGIRLISPQWLWTYFPPLGSSGELTHLCKGGLFTLTGFPPLPWGIRTLYFDYKMNSTISLCLNFAFLSFFQNRYHSLQKNIWDSNVSIF